MYCYTHCPQPSSRPHRPVPLLETPGHSQASLGQSLVGSLLLSPGSCYTQGSVWALQESIFPVLCNSGSSLVGLMVTSSKRTLAVPKSAAPRAPSLRQCTGFPLTRWLLLICYCHSCLLLFTSLPLLREYLPSVPSGVFLAATVRPP